MTRHPLSRLRDAVEANTDLSVIPCRYLYAPGDPRADRHVMSLVTGDVRAPWTAFVVLRAVSAPGPRRRP